MSKINEFTCLAKANGENERAISCPSIVLNSLLKFHQNQKKFGSDDPPYCQEQVHSLLDHIIPLQDTRSRYVHATNEDPVLKLVKELLMTGWPEKKEAMDGIHFGHFGQVKCVRRATSSVYWPGCDDKIRNMVASCSTFQKNRRKNPATSFPTRLPVHPFQMVHVDIF